MTARAITAAQKRAVVERLVAAWERAPHLRLGQLLVNALNAKGSAGAVSLFYIEDAAIVEYVEAFAEEKAK